MKTATGLATGKRPHAALAEAAVAQALEKLDSPRAAAILLYLTPDFSADAAPAVKAASRAGACLEVSGGLVHHPFTEAQGVIDQAAAAALVVAELPAADGTHNPWLTYRSQHPGLPTTWQDGPRFGLECAPGPAWLHGRQLEAQSIQPPLPGFKVGLRVSHGLQRLSPMLEASAARGLQLQQVNQQPALESLRRVLPPELRDRPMQRLQHLLYALPSGAPETAVAILETHEDGSLTLASPLPPGSPLQWAARLPVAAEAELNQQMEALSHDCPRPEFGLIFASLGRAPWFHEGEDAQLKAWQQHFGRTPLLGAYGDAQIVPTTSGMARLIHNGVITTLFSRET